MAQSSFKTKHMRANQRREARTFIEVDAPVVKDIGPHFSLSAERVQIERHNDQGLLIFRISPSVNDASENALAEWAQGIKAQVLRSGGGQMFTVIGSNEQITQLIERIDTNGSFKAGAKQILLARVHTVSGASLPTHIESLQEIQQGEVMQR